MTTAQAATVARLAALYRCTRPVCDGHAIRLDYRASTNAGTARWVPITIAPDGAYTMREARQS